ncbi:hypothetical protein HELRODRAFT_160398 [Helobdella robusta]|uniref:GrpE protein homolog n=1 Tax=Helobdella robusta TaxID=6412 RepID=T1EQ74_HELRO|nr:hypothetical protein HELRODRAFT_160398 [Helobdella robusta]ESO06240.1 hypothetical protein HELRODRAFT_160398 [Helobdella robusta]
MAFSLSSMRILSKSCFKKLYSRNLVHFQKFSSNIDSTTLKNEKQDAATIPNNSSSTDKQEDKKDVNILNAELLEEKSKLTLQLEEIKDKYKRALAETENVRQRLQKQIKDAKIFGIQGFCKDLLDVADILSKATTSLTEEQLKKENNPALNSLYEGLKMTEGQLMKVFLKHGLEKIDPLVGEKFNPNLHEALFQQPLPDADAAKHGDVVLTAGSIAAVSKVGYKLHDRTIRAALVGVFK